MTIFILQQVRYNYTLNFIINKFLLQLKESTLTYLMWTDFKNCKQLLVKGTIRSKTPVKNFSKFQNQFTQYLHNQTSNGPGQISVAVNFWENRRELGGVVGCVGKLRVSGASENYRIWDSSLGSGATLKKVKRNPEKVPFSLHKSLWQTSRRTGS